MRCVVSLHEFASHSVRSRLTYIGCACVLSTVQLWDSLDGSAIAVYGRNFF